MKIATLKNKLSKMNIEFSINDINGFNKDIIFKINNLTFNAGFNESSEEIEDLCRVICYNESEQEYQRRFFKNFNQLLNYAKCA